MGTFLHNFGEEQNIIKRRSLDIHPSQISPEKKHSVVEEVAEVSWAWKEAPQAPIIRTVNTNNETYNISPARERPKLLKRRKFYSKP